MNNPPVLYKYRPIKPTTERLFTLGEIWCSRPSDFNDPFECRPVISFDQKDPKTEEWLRKGMARRGIKNPGKRIQVTAQFRRRFSNPVAAADIGVDRMLDRVGIYSLTADPQSLLMWAHYANEHRGICVGFDVMQWPFNVALPIHYSADYPVINQAMDTNEETLRKCVLTKADCWGYEKEWRVPMRELNARERAYHEARQGDAASQVILKQRGHGAYEIHPSAIKRVIFGLRTDEEDKIKIREWIRTAKCSPELFQARQHKTKFLIEVESFN